MARYDLATIGEGQIRLTCHSGERIVNARQLRMSAACSEANIAGLMAQLGRKTTWATVMPDSDLTKRCISEYRSTGIDLSHLVYRPGRNAIYFMENGSGPMPARVTYDREHTPFRELALDDLNWDALTDTRLALVTGITAALTPNTAHACTYFVNQAAQRGAEIILDVNYRSLLWSPQTAQTTLEPLAQQAQIVFCSIRDAKTVFGAHGEGPTIAKQLRDRFDCPIVISTDSNNGVHLATREHTKSYPVTPVPILDRPGAGDAFIGAVLHGYLAGALDDGIRWGQRTAAYALTHHGDLTYVTPAELDIPSGDEIIR